IINPGASQAVQPGYVQFSEGDAGGNEQRATADFRSIRQSQDAAWALDTNAPDFLGRQNLHPKAPGLGNGAPRKIVAAEPHRKTKIVFNPKTPARLPAGSFAFNQQCV